jgi:hypothetical protein
VPETERVDGGNGARPGIVARLDKLISAAAELFSTRSQIFGEELSRKGGHLARGIAAATIAATLAFLAFLLLAKLVAAFFARFWAPRGWGSWSLFSSTRERPCRGSRDPRVRRSGRSTSRSRATKSAATGKR